MFMQIRSNWRTSTWKLSWLNCSLDEQQLLMKLNTISPFARISWVVNVCNKIFCGQCFRRLLGCITSFFQLPAVVLIKIHWKLETTPADLSLGRSDIAAPELIHFISSNMSSGGSMLTSSSSAWLYLSSVMRVSAWDVWNPVVMSLHLLQLNNSLQYEVVQLRRGTTP